MKKVIVSLLLLVIFALSSCNKHNEFIIDYNRNIIKDELVIKVYLEEKDSVYLKKENIESVYLKSNNLIMYISIENIEYIKKIDNYYLYEIKCKLPNSMNEYIIIKEGILKITYVNKKELNILINNLAYINVLKSYDIGVTNIKLEMINNENYVSIKVKNNNGKLIKIEDILLVNACFRAEMLDFKDIIIKDDDIIKIKIVSYDIFNNYNSKFSDAGFVIKYSIDEEIRYKVINNFRFIDNNKEEVRYCYVTN